MFYYYNALQTKSGDILPDYLVRLLDADGNEVDIYADDSETPIITVSGVANAAKADDLGMVRFWVPNGIYDLSIYDATDTFKGSEPGIPMFDAGAVVSDLASHDADKGASLVSMEGGGTVEDAVLARPTASTLASSSGSSTLGFISNVADAVARTAESKLRDVINAKDFGVAADGSTDDTTALQNAIDYMTSNEVDGLVLPRGEILLSGDVTIPPHSGVTDYDRSVTLIGQGAGENGSFLHFTSGSLIVNASSHYLADFQVTSDDTNGIEIKPSTGTIKYPARSMMKNISAYDCAESGITIEDCWVYVMINIMARRNTKYGIEGKAGVNFSTACNGWKIMGGEFQGNGAAVASGASKSTGGGIFTGRCVNLILDAVSIEGNVGDGLVLGEQMRGLAVIGGYFEKNGSNHLDCDIRNDAPSSPAFGPNSVFIVNPNFTPQATNGTVQERAIDLYDVIDLKIVNPQFFEEGSAGVYSAEPIRVRETLDGRCTGWVEGGAYLSLNYTQAMVKNETFRFGYPTRHRFCPDLALVDAATTTSQRFFVPMSNLAGRRVDVNHYTRPNAATGTARLITTIRRGPAGSSVSIKTDDVVYASSVNSKTQTNFTSYSAASWGQTEVTVARDGAHANDTLAADTRLLCVEIITYEGRVAAGA